MSYSPALQAMIDDIQAHYSAPVKIVVEGPASGQLSHEQSQQELLPDGTLQIRVTDTTNVEYTLSHELLHLLLQMKGYPQLQYHLLTGTPNLDDQLYATSTSLYNVAAHALIAAWQRENGIIDATVEEQVQAAFTATVPVETPETSDLIIFRILTLVDFLTFFNGGTDAHRTQWGHDFPRAFQYAQGLYTELLDKPIDTPFTFRRAVVQLFNRFDDLLNQLGYQPTTNPEFATIPPVLSNRQLRLTLNQVFELKHSDYRDRSTKDRAYVALGISDQQNAFVLPLQGKAATPEAFQVLYQQPLHEIFDQYHIDYTVRE
ncbi:hypothetical protein [Lacticaseibacillus brantae]|uniref:IpaB EvcA family protein n=1 Tax=Lacticaseibacillus brantae DSM 23927 TaxID=1423727 RepID=A0A0R2B6N7_9LACO|nr:hypothetical protein [Lacticaseibacillus brantae]KRM71299.1 hypothetical protein FC34_GL001779 [Lacticaseibacillus brantae DSM 23927]